MAMIPTSQLIEEYLTSKGQQDNEKVVNQYGRPELYAYEDKIGKQLVEMNEDEVFEMLSTFKNNKDVMADDFALSVASFTKYVSNYRQLIDYYHDKYELVRNPFRSPRFRGAAIKNEVSAKKEKFTKEDLDGLIEKIHAEFPKDRAEYYELILLLFYNGFANTQEIALLKEEMINFKKSEVTLPGRVIRLSNRCLSLLRQFHNADEIEAKSGTSTLVSWRNSYFKFIVKPSSIEGFEYSDLANVSGKINVIIRNRIAKVFGVNVTSRKVYLLGFYDYLVEQYGLERTKELIQSSHEQGNYEEFIIAANNYPIASNTMGMIKYDMLNYI